MKNAKLFNKKSFNTKNKEKPSSPKKALLKNYSKTRNSLFFIFCTTQKLLKKI